MVQESAYICTKYLGDQNGEKVAVFFHGILVRGGAEAYTLSRSLQDLGLWPTSLPACGGAVQIK